MKLKKIRSLFSLLAGLLISFTVIGAESIAHDPEADAQKLVTTVWRGGDLEAVKRLLDDGVDINSHGKAGLTAYLAARLRGDTEMQEFLESRGANTKAEMPPRERVAYRLFAPIKTNGAGAAVLIARDGKILFKHGYGLADVSNNVPVTPETKFRIGSITKQFTAAAILKLQEAGKLSVEDKLSKYIADFPRGDEVRLHHLLTHTSGIHSYTSKPDFMETVTKPVKTVDLIESFKNDPYDFDPGKKWLYDNSGYFLLGYIIEKVSGQGYGEFLRQKFFAPLGMTNTGVHQAGTPLEHEALGYQFDKDEQFTRALNWDMSRAGGAGALYSTVEDLYRWNEAIFNGKVLKESSLKAAFTPVKTQENNDDPIDSGYGYGWGVSRLRGTKEISHGGGLQGFSSFLLRLPEKNFTVVVLANALPGAPGVEPGNMAHQLAEIYLGENLDPRPVLKANKNVSPSSFDALTGRYDYTTGILTVTRQGDHLFAQLGEQPRYEIFPKSETEFFWKIVDAQVTFVKDASGKVTKAIHRQNGQTINAPRLGDNIAEAKVDPAGYDALVGRYDYHEGKVFLTVSRDGDRLFAQMTGQPKFEIFPKSPTEFFWKVVSAQVTFVKDVDGKVTKVIHHQGGGTIEAPRVEDKK
jgi:CubicO group peptidase (beta-lactamase class C family)